MPVEFGVVTTRDPEHAFSLVADAYAAVAPAALSGDQGAFSCGLRHADAGPIGGDEWRFTGTPAQLRMTLEPLPFFMVDRVRSGRVDRFSTNDRSIVVSPDEVFVVGGEREQPMDIRWTDLELDTLRVSWETIDRVAAEMTGTDKPVHFSELRPVSAEAQAHWRLLSDYVHEQLREPGSALSEPLAQGRMTDLLAATALTTFANSAMAEGSSPANGALTPSSLRRAVMYIDACAHLPVTISEIADATGVTPRALCNGFARHLDTTPTAHLRRVRLQRVHLELRDVDPQSGATVAEIARRWGFLNPQSFSLDYLAAYGQTPEVTRAG